MIKPAYYADRAIILTTLLLVATGVVMVYSTSYVVAMNRFGDEYFFVKKHLMFAGLGFVVFAAASRVNYRVYRKLAYPALILAIVMLGLIYVPGLGRAAGGARRWLALPGLTFQPSEFAKFAVIVFLAYSLEAKKDVIKDFTLGFMPHVVIPGVLIALIMAQPDFGTAVTLSMLVFLMCFAAGVKLRYLLGTTACVLPVLALVVLRFGYMMRRLQIYMDPWKDAKGAGWQMVQSFIAFGSGGVWGVGLGEGRQKLFFLPEAHTDFIFSVIGEELGLVGVGVIILLYVGLVVSGVRVAFRAKDLFGTYLALGLSFMIGLQAIINMGVVMGMLPPKGLPLPLLSYGGTSLVMSMLSAGIILNIYIKSNEA